VAKNFKRKFKAIHEIIYAAVSEIKASSSQTVDGNDSNGEDALAGEDATGGALEGAAPAAQAAGDSGTATWTASAKKASAPRTKGAGRG
jgi:hypothetical protein